MNPHAAESAKKFYNAAYNVATVKSIQPRKTDAKALAIPEQGLQMHRSQSAPVVLATSKISNVEQVYRVEGGDHTFRNIFLLILLTGCIIFAVDLYKQMHQERDQLEIRRKKCYQQYIQNQCQNPVEAIRELCHTLEVCFKRDPEMTIRTSQVAAKLIGKLVGAFLNETSIWGAVFLLVLLIVLLVFIWGYSRRSETQETRFKRQ